MNLVMNVNEDFLARYHDQCLLLYFNPEDIDILFGQAFSGFGFKITKKSNKMVLFRFAGSHSKEEVIRLIENFLLEVIDYIAGHNLSVDVEGNIIKSSVLSTAKVKKLVQNLTYQSTIFETFTLAYASL